MTLLSASDDFRVRTLSAVNGLLSRFAYVLSLRNENGNYRHWGLSRIYGDKIASSAVAEAHTQLWLELLRTPLPKLESELLGLSERNRAQLMKQLKSGRQLGCPANQEGGGVRHFNSVLAALESLVPAKGGTHPAA